MSTTAAPLGWRGKLEKIRKRFIRSEDANITRLRRRRALMAQVGKRVDIIRTALFIAGYVWMLVIPSPNMGRGVYVDENALQAGQVTTHWNWEDVHIADLYLEQLEKLRDEDVTSEERAQFLATEFGKLGIPAATQHYSFSPHSQVINGTNAYAVLSSPRASGTEAMVISASWLSLEGEGDGTINIRGVATVLALAKFLKRYSLWAKDLVFVISDGYMDGMQAWLNAYHGVEQSNLISDRIRVPSGVIWTALNIDYPGHSFSHLGIFHEGLNGRLPNQDLLNSFRHISRYTGGVPVTLYDQLDPREHSDQELDIVPLLAWIPNAIRNELNVKQYAFQATNVLRHVKYQASGRGSGVHGIFHQFRIDAFTIFALPADGPHGFHAIGRVIESTLRTTNNLLERLHASFFFYILTSPERFVQIGNFLPSVVLISVAMMFGGLKYWVQAGWELKQHKGKGLAQETQWMTRTRPVLPVLTVMLLSHALGVLLLRVLTSHWFNSGNTLRLIGVFLAFGSLPLAFRTWLPRSSRHGAPTPALLKALNLCYASTVISITTVLNFSLAACLAVLLGLPLTFASPSTRFLQRVGAYSCYVLLALGWIVFLPEETRQSIWDWEVLGVWTTPFVCVMYYPLVIQSGLVCLF